MKLIAILLFLILAGCTTIPEGQLPTGEEPGTVPYGYIEMCNDPERYSEIHCPPKVEDEH